MYQPNVTGWPFNQQTIPSPGPINPMDSMPAQQLGRSIDRLPAAQAGGGAPSGGVTPPLWLVAVDVANVKVTSGTVNGIVPTGVNSNIDVSGTDGTWAIYLHATLQANGVPSAVEVLTDDTNTIPSDDADNAYFRIGTVEVASSEITAVLPALAWSQTFVACGRDPDDPTTTPGTYYWVVA